MEQTFYCSSQLAQVLSINQKPICSPQLPNKTIKHSTWPQTHFLQHHPHLDARLSPCFFFSFFFPCLTVFPFLTPQPPGFSFLFVCLSAPTTRDERKEPLAPACDHHHHCDWRHSDCYLGDSSSYTKQDYCPKI